MKKRPNILFIMTDEQKLNCIGYNNSEVYTPNLDELKKHCVNFVNGYTTNPSCVPARAAIFSGKYPSQCGAPAFITPLESTETTFMKMLRDNDYYTSVIGKQHFAGAQVDRGYDEEIIIDNHYPHFDEDNEYTRFLVENGFSSNEELLQRDSKFAWKWVADEKYHVDSFIGDMGAKWINDNASKCEKPWFLTLSFPGPHQPYDGIGLSTESLYDESKLTLPSTTQEDLKNKPKFYMEQLLCGSGNPGEMPVVDASEADIRRALKSYYATMSLIDKKIGLVLDNLKASGQMDNTVIFFTSDHGDYMGSFGMMGKGQYLSEALMRVPLLMKPAIKDYKGRDEEHVGYNFDIAATALDIAGIKIPKDMSAKSLLPFIEDRGYEKLKDCQKTPIYLEASNIRAIIRDGWKLIYYQDRDYGELYDLTDDEEEKNNVYYKVEFESIKWGLTKLLCDKMIDLGRNSHSPWNYNAPQI
jgi:arylsulfatase A-like enzyme